MKLRMWADLAMTVLLLCQMAWLLIGETTHEWTGTAMFLLFIVHHVLNRRWYGSLFKGKHGPAACCRSQSISYCWRQWRD